MNPEVDLFFRKVKKWQEEMEKLRIIALDCGLTEEFKWRHPCYAYKCMPQIFNGKGLNDQYNRKDK